jgi:hypothetical protein
MSTASPTYKIPESNWFPLCERLEKLSRRAKKLGRRVPTLNVVKEYSEVIDPKRGLSMTYYDITIESEPVCVNGWDFVASIEMGDAEVGLIINKTPQFYDTEVPTQFRNTGGFCDHCKLSRRRNSVYVVHHQVTSEWKQVGRNCLGQFLGGVDSEAVVQQMELLIALDSLCVGAGDGGFFGGSSECSSLIDKVLLMTDHAIKQGGWLSRTKAREYDPPKTATADIVRKALFNQPRGQRLDVRALTNSFSPTDADREFVEKVIAWTRSLSDQGESLNDYLHNLTVVCSKETVTIKHLGIVCSAIAAYKNMLARQQEQTKAESLKHVGTVGKRETFSLTLKDIKHWPGYMGGITTAFFFNDPDGNVVIWKASNAPDLEVGTTYMMTGKVKSHEEFRGRPQTLITHAKVGA